MLFRRIVVQVLSEPALDFSYAHSLAVAVVGDLMMDEHLNHDGLLRPTCGKARRGASARVTIREFGSKTGKRLELVPRCQDSQDFLETLANLAEVGRRPAHEREGYLLLVALALIAQMLARTGDGVPLFIQ